MDSRNLAAQVQALIRENEITAVLAVWSTLPALLVGVLSVIWFGRA